MAALPGGAVGEMEKMIGTPSGKDSVVDCCVFGLLSFLPGVLGLALGSLDPPLTESNIFSELLYPMACSVL